MCSSIMQLTKFATRTGPFRITFPRVQILCQMVQVQSLAYTPLWTLRMARSMSSTLPRRTLTHQMNTTRFRKLYMGQVIASSWTSVPLKRLQRAQEVFSTPCYGCRAFSVVECQLLGPHLLIRLQEQKCAVQECPKRSWRNSRDARPSTVPLNQTLPTAQG